LSNKKKAFPTFGEHTTSQEDLKLAEKYEPDVDKSDEEEKDTTTEPLNQFSDHKPDTVKSPLRSPLISWLYKQNMLEVFGYAPHYEHMLLAIFVCDPVGEKSDEGEKSPEPMEPLDQPSDQGCLPEVTPTMRSPPTNPEPEKKIGPIYQCLKELKLAEYGVEQKVEEAREEDKVSGNEKTDVKHHQEYKNFLQSEKSDEGEKSPEPMEPPDQPSDQGCLPEVIPTMRSPPTNPEPDQRSLPEVIPTMRSPPTNPVPDQGCLPEVIPTMRSPQKNSVPEKKIGPILKNRPKELELAECGAEQEVEEAREEVLGSEKTDVKHHQEDKDFHQSENLPLDLTSKNPAKKIIIPLKGFQPLPKTYIPIYPCQKDLLAELGSQEPGKEDKKMSGYEMPDAKNEIQESPKKSLNQSDNDPPQSGNIPSKDKIIKKKITFKVIHPSPLPQKDWYLSLQVKEGSVEKKKIKIKSEKTSKNQELTWTPLIFYVGKDDAIVFNVMEKKVSFGSMSRVLESSKWGPAKLKNNGKLTCAMKKYTSILPGLKVEFEVENILETIEKPDSGQNKRQQKINQSFLKNEFLHLKERLRKRRSM
jgi:hypothetical protein